MKPLAGLARAFAALQGRLYDPPSQTIAGVKPENFPTANQPVNPVGPKGSQPLAWSFWQGINQNITPRPDATLTFQDLRELATYPLARLLIESIKDQVASIKWTVQLREVPGESLQDRRDRQKDDKKIPQLTAFMDAPDSETPWAEWVRRILEDLIVIDAPAILLRRTLTGKVAQWRWTDGADILRLIDDQGYTPPAPSPAYTQLWEGVPRLFLTTDQLIYRPRNIVPRGTTASQLYGYSPVEAQAEEIKIGKARLNYVLSFYTDGGVPGLVQMVPPGVPTDKILEAMQWMNSELAGNLAARRQYRYVQSFGGDQQQGPKDQIHQLKEPVLADVYDELHIRKLSFAFGVSAQRLLKQMNRASAEANQDAAQEEGMLPWVAWLKGAIDTCFQRMGFAQYEAIPDTAVELDPLKQSQIDGEYVKTGIRTINEVRDSRGMLPRPEAEANQLGIVTATGWIPLAGAADRTDQAHQASLRPKPAPALPQGSGGAPKLLSDGGSHKKKVATQPSINPSRATPRLAIAKAKTYMHVAHFLHEAGKKAASISVGTRSAKADGDPDDIEALVNSVLDEIDWASLADLIEPDLSAAAIEGADIGFADLEVTEQALISEVNEIARDYAEQRSAEMVGMKRVDGQIVPNPNAAMRIDESTRNMVRQTIKEAFEADTPVANIAAELQSSHAFSESRAELIAENEVRQAQVRGNLEAWKASGVVEKFNWVLSGDHSCCDICDTFAEEGPYPLDEAEAMLLKTHPLCACILVAAKIKGIDKAA
jgi:hypothetical protein